MNPIRFLGLLFLLPYPLFSSTSQSLLDVCLANVSIQEQNSLTASQVASSNLPPPVKAIVANGIANEIGFNILAHGDHVYVIVPGEDNFTIITSVAQESTLIPSILNQALQAQYEERNQFDDEGRWGYVGGRTGGITLHGELDEFSVPEQNAFYHIALSTTAGEKLLLRTDGGYELFVAVGTGQFSTTYRYYFLPIDNVERPNGRGAPIAEQIINRGNEIINRDREDGMWGRSHRQDRDLKTPNFTPNEVREAAWNLASSETEGTTQVISPTEGQHLYAGVANGNGGFRLYRLHRDEVIPE